ncbi:hypothetical protein [uncultured Gammaproteobacteria bacterium]|jgi:Zn-dependent metalloprotease|nr:hypothetical protein [uncultured Gammaproteobacteria bacterium]CAC9559885.1 hypothetical protein [uncultured Gammaproteobacteria bacterium]CAC9564553.1 hypothetical protein [uncultured Gammaproteobacteria bacterium]CAC9952095.1 hypothetical protein [uncultured Gammaproteobacteria bacterium]
MTTITRILILCGYLGSTYAWGGFFHLDVDAIQGINSMSGTAPTLEQQARSSILERRAQLNLNNNEALLFQRVNTDRFGNQHFRFNVTYKGIELEKMQIIAHFDQGIVSSLSGYQQSLSPSFKNKIDTHLNQEKPQLTTDKVLAFINKKQHKVLSIKPMIIQAQPYVIWQVQLLINGITTVYRVSDSNPPSILSKIEDIQY